MPKPKSREKAESVGLSLKKSEARRLDEEAKLRAGGNRSRYFRQIWEAAPLLDGSFLPEREQKLYQVMVDTIGEGSPVNLVRKLFLKSIKGMIDKEEDESGAA